MSNRLKDSSSAYLRSAAHQPIDWYEFGEEAFERARELDRPVLLDIGAVWCHWCHVIDRESYEDDEIAQLINEHFIAVKVDRDQRPDIDTRYQQVVAQLTGRAGWPLTGFLSYDGRLIYGGTYFPPHVMKSLLLQIQKVYQDKKEEILSAPLPEQPVVTEPDPMLGSVMIDGAIGERLEADMKQQFDVEFGGFGHEPKFPHFSALELLITRLFRNRNQALQDVLDVTLTKMAEGGIYDQIGGGFHRYSVDRIWHVPHFEKMAYDNAEALKVYAQAHRLTNNLLYRHVAEGIIDWVGRDLCDAERGGFYASQDADIDLEDDGDYFTWTRDELKAALASDELDWLTRYYGVTDKGDMHERPGRNVLMVSELRQEEDTPRLEGIRQKLLSVREGRPQPFIDDSIYVNWNGMMIVGYLDAADLLELPDARAFALKTVDRILSELYRPDDAENMLSHSAGAEGFLDDYAQFALALLRAYQTSGEGRYLDAAVNLVNHCFAHFEDSVNGAFYDVRDNDAALGMLKYRRKPVEDSPSSSANGIMLQVLTQLDLITGEPVYRGKAERLMRFFLGRASQMGLFASAFAIGVDRYLNPPLALEMVGEKAVMQAACRQVFYPGRIIQYAADGQASGETDPQSEVRLCVGTQCLPPVQDVGSLLKSVETLCEGAMAP